MLKKLDIISFFLYNEVAVCFAMRLVFEIDRRLKDEYS